MMDCVVVRPLGLLLYSPIFFALSVYILNTIASGVKTKKLTMAKVPRPHRHPAPVTLLDRKESAARGPVKAVQMNGVEAKANAKARFRRPKVSAMKMSKIR